MKEDNEITGLFRTRLTDAEMSVREDFWEQIQHDLPGATASVETSPMGKEHLILSPRFHRVAAAASVAFVLGAASAAFWYFSPKEEIQEAFTQVAALTPDGSLKGDVAQETFPSIHQVEPMAQKSAHQLSAVALPAGFTVQTQDEDESISVHLSITITESTTTPAAEQEITTACPTVAAAKPRNWAIKAGIGTALPKGDFHLPTTASVTVERRLNEYLSLETGLQYTRLPAPKTLHTLAVPVRVNLTLASTSKIDLYTTLGGMVEKCIAGAPDTQPAQISVMAGLGVRYKLNDRFALFAEPSVSHHFDTDASMSSLRTARSTNMNLLCGMRVTY